MQSEESIPGITPYLQSINQHLLTVQDELRTVTSYLNKEEAINQPLKTSYLASLRHQKATLLEQWQLKYLWVTLSQYSNSVAMTIKDGSSQDDPLLDDLRVLIEHLHTVLPDYMFEYEQLLAEKKQSLSSSKAEEAALAQCRDTLYQDLLQVTSINLIEKHIHQLKSPSTSLKTIDSQTFRNEFNRQLLTQGALDEFEFLSIMHMHRHLSDESNHSRAENAISFAHGKEHLKAILYAHTRSLNLVERFDGTKALKAFIEDTDETLSVDNIERISKKFFETQIVRPNDANVTHHLDSYRYYHQEAIPYDATLLDGKVETKLAHEPSLIALDTKRLYNQADEYSEGEASADFPLYTIIDEKLLDQLSDTQLHYLSITEFFNSPHFDGLTSFLNKTFRASETFLARTNTVACHKWQEREASANYVLPFHDKACSLIDDYLSFLNRDDLSLNRFHNRKAKVKRKAAAQQLRDYITRASARVSHLRSSLDKLVTRYSSTLSINQELNQKLLANLSAIEEELFSNHLPSSQEILRLRSFYAAAEKLVTKSLSIDTFLATYDTKMQESLSKLLLVHLIQKNNTIQVSNMYLEEQKFLCKMLNLSEAELMGEDCNKLIENEAVKKSLSKIGLTVDEITTFNPKIYGYRLSLLDKVIANLDEQQALIKSSKKDCLIYIETIKLNKPHFNELRLVTALQRLFESIITALSKSVGFFLQPCRHSVSLDSQPIKHSTFISRSTSLFTDEHRVNGNSIELIEMNSPPTPTDAREASAVATKL